MATLPFTASECFFFAILAFAVMGFYRGWKKEVLSLLFILIAAFLVRPSSGGGFTEMLARLPATISYLLTGTVSPPSAPAPTNAFLGPLGPVLAFLLIAALGYYLGEKAFPKPASPTERILGILPAITAGALFLGFLNSSNFFAKDPQGHSVFSIMLQPPDPGQFVPVLLVISILVVIGGLIATRAKKTAGKK
jgi:hypothetical protein